MLVFLDESILILLIESAEFLLLLKTEWEILKGDFISAQSTLVSLKKSDENYMKHIDLIRLKKEIIDPLINDTDIQYQSFNCKTQELSAHTYVKKKKINIIEGAYSMHPDVLQTYNIKIFMKSNIFQQISPQLPPSKMSMKPKAVSLSPEDNRKTFEQHYPRAHSAIFSSN